MSWGKSDAVLLQHASAESRPMLHLTLQIHSEYCLRHNIDYQPFFGLSADTENKGPHWEKNRLLMKAFEAGYRYVIFLDLDTLILPDCPDLREAVPPGAIGCVWHDADWKQIDPEGKANLYDHFNIGCMYIEQTQATELFLREWFKQEDDGHCWGNQNAFKKMCLHWPSFGTDPVPIVHPISRDWNSTPTHPGENPKVLAWHGYGTFPQRMAVMAQAIEQHYSQRAQTPPTIDDQQRMIWQQAIDARESSNKAFAVGNQPEGEAYRAESARLYESVVSVDPNNVQAWLQYAVLMTEMKEYQKSNHAFTVAAGLNPQEGQAWHGIAFTYSFLGFPKEADAANEICLRLCPDMPTARWNKSNMLLAMGDFEQGWKEYEWGPIARMRPVRMQKPPLSAYGSFPKDYRQVKEENAKVFGPDPAMRILCWPEQGMGDTIMSVRFLKQLKERTGATLWLEVQDSLYPLLQSFEHADFVYVCPKDNCVPLPWDEHVSLMSLPYVLGLNDSDDFRSEPYIKADARKSAWWKQMLEKETPGKFKVGYGWRGSATHANDKWRSTDLAMWSWMGEMNHSGEIASISLDPEHNKMLLNWSDTAALIENLDLVISVDTSIVHLAGAMGKPVWTLLPFNADWRWRKEGDTTPWYESMRLFRQETIGEWGPVFECVRHELKMLIGTRSMIEYASNIPADANTQQVLQKMTAQDKFAMLKGQVNDMPPVINPAGRKKR